MQTDDGVRLGERILALNSRDLPQLEAFYYFHKPPVPLNDGNFLKSTYCLILCFEPCNSWFYRNYPKLIMITSLQPYKERSRFLNQKPHVVHLLKCNNVLIESVCEFPSSEQTTEQNENREVKCSLQMVR